MIITREIATKVRDTIDAGLVRGLGIPIPGQMCVEAAVCYALGDNPSCVSPALRRLKIRLNDSAWSSDAARATGLRRLALAQLGSNGVLDERVFATRVVEMTIRVMVPIAFRAVAKRVPKHAGALDAAAVRCERDGDRASARSARDAADAAAYASSSSSSVAAATYAASATYAAYAAAYAASYASAYSSSSVAAASVASRTRDRVLGDFAEFVVQILIDMDAPGAQWLDLVPI